MDKKMEKKMNKNQLIEEAKKIADLEERALFIMHYFLETVSYDYAYLLGAGYAQGDLTKLLGECSLYKNPFKSEGDNLPEILLKYKTDQIKGENGEFLDHSDMVSDIVSLEKDVSQSGGSYEEFIDKVKEYFIEQLSKHLDNPGLVEENVSRLMAFLLKESKSYTKVPLANGGAILCYHSLEYALMELILKKDDKLNPLQLTNDDLITRGVCHDYSVQIVPLLQELGIDAYCIGGTSELGHEWIIAKINGKLKSLDLTRAVFIRDGFRGIPKDQTMDEWLFCDVQHSLDMQSTRTIREINDESIGKVIDAHNYDEEEFKILLQEFDEKNKNKGAFKLSDINNLVENNKAGQSISSD